MTKRYELTVRHNDGSICTTHTDALSHVKATVDIYRDSKVEKAANRAVTPMHKDIAVWFSCGAASAAAAHLTIGKYGRDRVRVVNSPVVEEHPDNLRFLRDVEIWLGVEIESASNPKYPTNSAVDVWAKRKFMSGPRGAPCTVELKKEARYAWERVNNPAWHVLGFTVEEKKRHDRFVLTERDNVLPVLIDAGMTKDDCKQLISSSGIDLPRIYDLGYPNANCIGCVKATSSKYWNLVRETFPDVFEQRAQQSRSLGVRLARYKGERVFLDELPRTSEGQMEIDFDCGVFCEEPKT